MLGIHPLQGLTRKIYHSYDAKWCDGGMGPKIEDLLSTMWGPRSIDSVQLVPISPISRTGLWYANNEL